MPIRHKLTIAAPGIGNTFTVDSFNKAMEDVDIWLNWSTDLDASAFLTINDDEVTAYWESNYGDWAEAEVYAIEQTDANDELTVTLDSYDTDNDARADIRVYRGGQETIEDGKVTAVVPAVFGRLMADLRDALESGGDADVVAASRALSEAFPR
ncbi:hypothetical protein [Leifsonia sp. Leaf264]|uniref:hypothetical protein n=1 Tax=Leifsonia sp. Leaf264 TaxID=1736314 RepID=UPI0006F7C9AF|nr:hypothetical protein [Leifsonia sp. Leaf264]KQO98329.1 hypothetical protein ASF30_09725 [Leifsonia sp. Leaf264]